MATPSNTILMLADAGKRCSRLGREPDHELGPFAVRLAGIPAPALDNPETRRGHEGGELVGVITTHGDLQGYFVHERFACIAAPHELRIKHQRIAIEASPAVVTGQAAARQRDFPGERFLLRNPAP